MRSHKKTKLEVKKVVIVGGGFGGLYLARKLETKKGFKVVLIEPKDFFVYIPLIHEVAVGEIPSDTVKVFYKSVLRRTLLVKERAKEIRFNNKKVKLENGREINYDIIVVAMGSNTFCPFPCSDIHPVLKTLEDALRIKRSLTKILENRNPVISVVGEGPTGTEIITEIASLVKSLKVKIILNHFLYFSGYFLNLPKFNEKILKKMKDLNVNVYLNEPVKKILHDEIKTERGSYKSDYIIVCTGVKPIKINTDINAESGFLINSYCQIEEQEDAYAIGDVALLPFQNDFAPKLALIARQQATYLLKYLTKKQRYKRSKSIKFLLATFVSLGRYDAVGRIMDYITISGKLPWILKRSVYFIQIFILNKDYKLLKTLLISMISKNRYFN